MQNIFLISSILFTTTLFSQQQQRIGNVFVNNNANPPAQFASNNVSNMANFDNNIGNQMDVQTNENNDNVGNLVQQSSIQFNEVNDSPSHNNKSFSLDLGSASRSFSSSSSSKTNRKTFFKKVSKFKRNFYGKIVGHKKSRHQVDICFNWR